MNRIKVMLVDDHPVVREGLRMLLSEEPDIDVVGEADDGAEVVALARQLQPDVIVMDLMMPHTDGVAATGLLRAAGVPSRVLVLTSFADDGQVRAALSAGAAGYLLKDVRKPDLLRAIQAAARGEPTLHPQAQRELMRQFSGSDPHAVGSDLTARERDVLRLLAQGNSNKQIAAALHLSEGTVKWYISAILTKLNVADRTQAALYAVKHGLVQEG